jgi:hypothetical protein
VDFYMPQIVSPQQIADYIAAVERSGALSDSVRQLWLLEHLIVAENTGQGGTLTADSIGLEVFAKSERTDPSRDIIVREEVGQLRTAIAVFEGSRFADTELKVEIAVGTYRPDLGVRAEFQSQESLKDLRPVFFYKTHPLGRIILGVCLAVVAVILLISRIWSSEPVGAAAGPAMIVVSITSSDFCCG